MTLPISDETMLIRRLVRVASANETRQIVFLVGAPLTMATAGSTLGVPGVTEMLDLIRQELGDNADLLDDLDIHSPTAAYQQAFQHLQDIGGQDAVSRVIRRAILRARLPSRHSDDVLKAAEAGDQEACERIQYDFSGWHLNQGVAALGKIMSYYPLTFGRVALTTNFDPLIEVAVEREYGRVFSTALHGDGSLSTTYGMGCHIVHLHGYWFGSDTLHTPHHLEQSRPNLENSIRRLIENRMVVVLAYGGWNDIFTKTLVKVMSDTGASLDLVWTFHTQNEQQIDEFNDRLLREASSRGRVMLVKGVSVHEFFPNLLEALQKKKPADMLTIYQERTQRYFEARPILLSDPDSHKSIGEWVKGLKAWGDLTTLRAAVAAAEYALPIYEGREPSDHSESGPKRDDGPRKAVQATLDYLSGEKQLDSSDYYELAYDANSAATMYEERPVGAAARAACEAALALSVYTGGFQRTEMSVEVHAARAVHAAFRAARGDELAVWNFLALRIRQSAGSL
ncbi:MAG: hypothetical protein JWL77_4767 [Chthonomonadaceae bacterium]|nr:hypothetical protein [Chthonomonadaceae bacterium]